MTPYDKKELLIDIETAPNIGLFWGAGWKKTISTEDIIWERQMICASWKWRGEKKVHNMTWTPKVIKKTIEVNGKKYTGYELDFCDKKLVKTLIKVLDQADEIIYQNGDRFDLPWIRARALYHRLEMRPTYRTFDTLKKSRGNFYLNSHRLDYRRKYCGGTGKIKTEYEWWKRIRLDNDQKLLAKMVRYCDKDVLELEKDYETILPYVTPNTHTGVIKGFAKWTCPYCGGHDVRRKVENVTAAGTVRHSMYCKKGHHYTISDATYRQFLKERSKKKGK